MTYKERIAEAAKELLASLLGAVHGWDSLNLETIKSFITTHTAEKDKAIAELEARVEESNKHCLKWKLKAGEYEAKLRALTTWPGDENVREALKCAEDGGKDCPTYYDGCHCGEVLAAALRAKSAECERLREAIKKSRLLIEANNGNEDLNWMDDVDMILFGALAPRAEKPAGEGE